MISTSYELFYKGLLRKIMRLFCDSIVIIGIHQFKTSIPFQAGREKPHKYDPIPPVASDIANNTWLLCFDEFQVISYHLELKIYLMYGAICLSRIH